MSMLTKQHRLPKKEIDQVKNNGHHFHTPFFTVVYLSGRGTPSQFAFVLSKRVSKKATIRNRTKRLIAGAVRRLMAQLKSGYWVIFLVRRAALDQDKEILAQAVKEAFGKINLLKQNEKLGS
jgi:ribonuclease P protein component